jgi:hypothetical protein
MVATVLLMSPACMAAVLAQSSNGTSAQATNSAPAALDLLTPSDLDKLVGPVALYPDPLLSLILQASTQPLEIVQADRFLDKRKTDPNAQPPSTWDSSVLGLLNYPPVVKSMSDQLDWTQKLGDAVLNQLGDVQASIQQVRSDVRARGGLLSDDKNSVVVQNGLIEILPTDPDKIYIPQYDAASLEPPPSPPARPPATQVTASTSSSTTTVQAKPAGTTVVETTTPTTVVVQEPAYAYAYPPPPVTYAEPYPSYTSSAATFLGGAVVGGLLGYAIGDSDHDVDVNVNRSWNGYDHGYYGAPAGGWNNGNRTNISGNTINVVGSGDRISATSVQSELQQRVGGGTTVAASRQAVSVRSPSPVRPTISAVAGEASDINPSKSRSGGFGDVTSAREANATRTRTATTRATWSRSTADAGQTTPTAGNSGAGRSYASETDTSLSTERMGSASVFSRSSAGSRDGIAGSRGAKSRLGSRSGGRFRG